MLLVCKTRSVGQVAHLGGVYLAYATWHTLAPCRASTQSPDPLSLPGSIVFLPHKGRQAVGPPHRHVAPEGWCWPKGLRVCQVAHVLVGHQRISLQSFAAAARGRNAERSGYATAGSCGRATRPHRGRVIALEGDAATGSTSQAPRCFRCLTASSRLAGQAKRMEPPAIQRMTPATSYASMPGAAPTGEKSGPNPTTNPT
jgi:hypothetical protein